MREQTEKVCSKCGIKKEVTEFYKDKRYLNGIFSWCKACCSARARKEYDPRESRRDKLERRYGLTLEQYDNMLKAQNNLCALCKREFTPKEKLCVDHNHATKEVRGILHNSCNMVVGLAKDSVSFLRQAIEYLERKKKITIYDPSGGWKYGFPKQYLPLPGETVEETLRRDGYPESLVELAEKHSRFWEQDTEEKP